MKTALRLALAVAVSTFSAGVALAQQGPGLTYFNDHMTTLGVAQSQERAVPFLDNSRSVIARGARRDRDNAIAESPARAEQRPRAVR